MQVNTNSSGDESLISNFVQFVGLVVTVYGILYVVGGWKAVDRPANIQTSSYTTAFTATGIVNPLPEESAYSLKDSMLFTQQALHTAPCERENSVSDDNFMRIELPTDRSCARGSDSKSVEL